MTQADVVTRRRSRRTRTGEIAEVSVDPTGLSDAELLAGCADNPDLYAEFYRRHSRTILTWLVRRTGCAQIAADLAAETFAQAFVSRKRFTDQGKGAAPWLYGIARNLLGKYLRREKVSRKYQRQLSIRPTELSGDEIARVEALVDLDAMQPDIAAALDTLPGGQAEAIRLRVMAGLDYVEVAARLGVSQGAVRVRVSRGLTRLAELLEEGEAR